MPLRPAVEDPGHVVRVAAIGEGLLAAAALAWIGLRGLPVAVGDPVAGVLWGPGLGVAAALVPIGLFRLVPKAWGVRELRRVHIDVLHPLFGGLTVPQIVLISVAAGVGEELLFRGALQTELGMVTATVVFAALHVGGRETLPLGVWAGVLGVGLGWERVLTGGVLAPMLTHAMYDVVALLYIRRTPRPGGTTGDEGRVGSAARDEEDPGGPTVKQDNRMSTRLVTGLFSAALVGMIAWPSHTAAQQRPLVTEDPETVGPGRLLIEAGFDYGRDQLFPVTGLEGHLLRVPLVGFSFGIGPIAELQIDGGFYNSLTISRRLPAQRADDVTAMGDTTSSIEDFVIGTKIRLASETVSRPAIGLRVATKLPNASVESGLGRDTTDFFASLLIGKTTRSTRLVANAGLGILADSTGESGQNDVLAYGLSVSRALVQDFEVVAEINGHLSLRDNPPVGTDTRATVRVGTRYTHGPGRVDGGLLVGTTSQDPGIGFTVGYTHVFDAFTAP